MQLPKLNSVEPPKDERSLGEATFNYASYDGRFVIGAEPWAFETRWSSASQGSAHLYNDPAAIEGVAIAEGITSIGQATPDVVASADFTSRTRTPRVGQVVLLRNTASFFAAVELLEVGYPAVPSGNVMRFRFAIQTDRSTDFSPFASAFDGRQALTDQLLAAAADAERALRAVPTGEDSTDGGIVGIGHNQPPPEFAITEADRAETLAAIDAIREEAVSAAPSTSRLRTAGQTIARVAGKVAKWIGGKTDAAADEFAKAVGKAAGVAAVGGFAAWLTLQGKLAVLVDILGKFAG
ncbi:hypothetical protein [Sphingomonas ginsenosidimutans]|jgi:hypothetical protein|nr:hypothetical protein [Sphingomonas ginsenosidimutans]